MAATNPSASISFTDASAVDGNGGDWRHTLEEKIKMEDLHVVEAMDQDAVSEPITADGMERHINLGSH